MIKRLCLILFSIILLLMASCKEEQHYIRFFVGSYAPADSTGIYTCELNPETGAAKVIHSLSGIQNPSYLALHPDAPVLYAVAEAADKNTQSGAVWSLSLADDGSLEGMNQASSGGAHPCHLSVDQDGQLVLVANYSGGNLGLIPIREDHQTGQLVQVYQHLGSGPNPDRQTRAHAHSVNIHPKLAKAYACDLGTDEVLVYNIDFEKQMMQLDSTAIFKSSPGAGPRHLDFSPDARQVYVINELNSTMDVLNLTEEGGLIAIQTISTLPDGYTQANHCADVHVHPSGDYVYGSNRGHNSIVVYKRDQQTGKLTLVQHQAVRGDWPRNFAISPDGDFLIVANRRSNNLVVFAIDVKTGELKPTGYELTVSQPVCIKFSS